MRQMLQFHSRGDRVPGRTDRSAASGTGPEHRLLELRGIHVAAKAIASAKKKIRQLTEGQVSEASVHPIWTPKRSVGKIAPRRGRSRRSYHQPGGAVSSGVPGAKWSSCNSTRSPSARGVRSDRPPHRCVDEKDERGVTLLRSGALLRFPRPGDRSPPPGRRWSHRPSSARAVTAVESRFRRSPAGRTRSSDQCATPVTPADRSASRRTRSSCGA